MKYTELQEKINSKANEIKSNYKTDFKNILTEEINKVLDDAKLEAHAYYDYSDKSNTIKISPKGKWSNEYNWPIYVEYKTSRKTLAKSHYWGNTSEYTLKSIEVLESGKREVEEGKEIEIETIEDYLKAEELWLKRQNQRKENSIQELKDYISVHPEFEKMVELYRVYKYQLK